MKKIFLILTFSLSFAGAFAQLQDNSYSAGIDNPRVFIGFSTGIDNMIGLLGPQIDFFVVEKLSLGAGVSISSWGYKYAFNAQFFPKQFYKYYFKAGYSRNSGLDGFETELELENGQTEKVKMDLKPVSNVLLTAGHGWKLGKRNRIYLELGYAIPINADKYYVLYDPAIDLSKNSESVLKILRPGGLVIAAGFNFAID